MGHKTKPEAKKDMNMNGYFAKGKERETGRVVKDIWEGGGIEWSEYVTYIYKIVKYKIINILNSKLYEVFIADTNQGKDK